MLVATVATLALLVGRSAAGAYPPDVVDKLADEGLSKLKSYLNKNPAGNCTLENAVRRKEWSDLSIDQRQDYTRAVLCLQSKTALTSATVAPGAKSRFDDYVVTHILQTPWVHNSTSFFSWHRYYIWHYENALRTECGYAGYQPYWNWDRYAKDPINSPLFNGNDSSIGGNGAFVLHAGVTIPRVPPPFDVIPPAEGGGCVTSGPFMNMSVNVGPIASYLTDIKPNPQPDGLGYNPRCLRRDVNKYSAVVTVASETYKLITENNHTDIFETVLEGQFEKGLWGVHVGGHYTVGGDPGGDFFCSPGDPAFWLHHAMIDRVWWIWQMQDIATRLTQVAKTLTMNNDPPSRNGTLDDLVGLTGLAKEVPLRELMNTMGGLNGEFCYIYE